MGMSYDVVAFEHVSDDQAHAGDFVGFVAYKDTTISAMTGEQISGNALSSMDIAAGTEIYVRFTSVTCASGSGLFLYKA
jgi:hypothetical protein